LEKALEKPAMEEPGLRIWQKVVWSVDYTSSDTNRSKGMELLQQFLEHPQAELVMLIGGGLLSLFGFIQVVRKGFALVFWLVLFAAGMFPVMYVFKGSDADFLASARNHVSDLGNMAPTVRDDVLKVWCDKLEEAGM